MKVRMMTDKERRVALDILDDLVQLKVFQTTVMKSPGGHYVGFDEIDAALFGMLDVSGKLEEFEKGVDNEKHRR